MDLFLALRLLFFGGLLGFLGLAAGLALVATRYLDARERAGPRAPSPYAFARRCSS